MPRPPRAILLGLVAVLCVSCGDAAPAVAPVTATPPPAAGLPVPDGDTAREQILLHGAAGTFDRYASIGQLQGGSSTCTAVLLDTGDSSTAPAYGLTSGHCVGITGANDVLVGRPADGMRIAFDWFADVPEHRLVPVASIAWATVRGTDLALLELAATPAELRGLGLRGWAPEALPAGPSAVDVLMLGIPIGAPIVDIPETERYLRLGTCSLDAAPVVLNERQWLWTAALRNDCPEVLPGNSGSAVISRSTGGLVGVINTTTHEGDQRAECWLGRPCEVTAGGEAAYPDASYAQPVAALAACFGSSGTFSLRAPCTLVDGTGVTELDGAPLAVNPSATDPLTGAPGPATWATAVATDGASTYRYKVGPLGATRCADEAGYGDPVPVARIIDDRLPRTEQRLLLCVIADGQAPSAAAAAVAYVDTTPPAAPIRFSIKGDRASGWIVEPVFDPPELSLFEFKSGPAQATDCDDPAGYIVYRRQPVRIGGAAAPVRFCARGYDDADNPSKPASKVLG